MSRRVLAALAAAALALAACGGGNGGGGDDATTAPTGAPTAAATLSPAPTSTLVEDGVFTGQGILLPIPDGWRLEERTLRTGFVAAFPQGAGSQQLLLAADDVTNNPQVPLQGDNVQALVEAYKQQIPQPADVDESIDFQGAQQAHQLIFRDLPAQQTAAPTPAPSPSTSDQLVIIAGSGDGQFALFNYVASSGSYSEDIAEQVRTQGGLDPESEPSRPPVPTGLPTAPATGTPGGGG